MDAAPQALQPVQSVPGQPRLELAVGAHLLLQGLERFHPRRQVGLFAALGIHGLLAPAPVVVELGHLLLQFMQAPFRCLGRLLRTAQLRLQVGEPHDIGRRQCVAIGGQPVAAQVQRAGLFLDVALVGGQHLDLLLHLRHAGALRGGPCLRLAQRVFQVWQLHRLLLDLRRQQACALFGFDALAGQRLHLGSRVVLAAGPLDRLLVELRKPLLHALAAFNHEADLGFQPSHFGARFVELALGVVDVVPGRVMRLPDGFQVGLDAAQVGDARLQLVHGLLGLGLDATLVHFTFRALEEPLLVLAQGGLRLPFVVLLRDLGLLFQLVEVAVQFAQDVLDPGQVFAGVAEPALGFAAPFLVLGDAGRFLQEQAQLFGLGLDDAADRALADDGVGTRAQAGAQEHVLHVAPAHRLVVDVVAAGAVAREHALDRDFRELAPLAAGAVVGVVEHQFHRGTRGRLAGGGAVEDDVLHRLAAQFAGARLAQHPAHGVHDVGLAAAVRPDHANQLAGQQEVGGFGEGLEPGELDGIETHDG